MTPNDLVLTSAGVRFQGRKFPCTIGRGGVKFDKHEGDLATPFGVHRIIGMLFRPDRISQPTSWADPIRPGDLWSDDTDDIHYNQLVRMPYAGSHEKLWRADPLYDLIILTDWNWPNAVARRGSAIFIHQWRRPGFPTEGCVAFERAHLHWIARRLEIGRKLVVR